MNLGAIAFGAWSGGRFMHFGEVLEETRWIECVQLAFEQGIRTFVTADVYGSGRADEFIGRALQGIPREEYCLVGSLGHDFYLGKREGSKGYARFTDERLRKPEQYAEFLQMACEKSLQRCQVDHFDLVLLHNPGQLGFEHPLVWEGLAQLKQQELTSRLGLAPGPANGFTLDVVSTLEKYGNLIDWAMLILNPLEPWPGRLALEACEKHQVDVLTRVVDHGGTLWGDVQVGHQLRDGDHRAFRPQGWIEHAWEKLARMDEIRQQHQLSWIHFACLWNLSHPVVKSVVPTVIQEADQQAGKARSIEEKIAELAALPPENPFTAQEREQIAQWGDNTGCMALKGGSARCENNERPDQWPLTSELREVAKRWDLADVYASEL